MMRVPFLDLKVQYAAIKEEVLPAIHAVLDNTAYVLGKPVSEFEAAFGREHGVQFCYGVSSGTDGNHMALWALGIGPGDEVLIPANTFIATAWGATLCGATPVFVDCEADSYNIDPLKVEAKITPRTKAIVAVHLYGQPADMDPLREIARQRKIALVEDCAQSHLAEYKGKRTGGLSVASSFSFYPGKNLGAYGEGGAVATNDAELARKFKMIRDHGAEKKYWHEMYGHNYRMEGIQGAVLGVKLRHLPAWTEGRRKNAALYNAHLKGIPGVVTPRELRDSRPPPGRAAEVSGCAGDCHGTALSDSAAYADRIQTPGIQRRGLPGDGEDGQGNPFASHVSRTQRGTDNLRGRQNPRIL
ncbi:MAG: putative pyridoxal phosphate-dependent enzyme [Bacteroidetes bacterium]|nr:putative pyridoxal phosphate-dependent enzyme [Bacteroidota bacterium]